MAHPNTYRILEKKRNPQPIEEQPIIQEPQPEIVVSKIVASEELRLKREKWAKYDFGHILVMRELNIDQKQLPDEICQKIRGLNLGLSLIVNEYGFEKIVMLSAVIGDSIITWYERDIKVEDPAISIKRGFWMTIHLMLCNIISGIKFYFGRTQAKEAVPAPLPSTKTKQSVFAGMVQNLERRDDPFKYPDSEFWFNKQGKFMFEYDKNKARVWCSYPRVWSVFKTEFGMRHCEVKCFTTLMIEDHFKYQGVTTRSRRDSQNTGSVKN
jgi:hypothetical protein